MNTLDFMVEKGKKEIIETLKTKIICKEVSEMLHAINNILNEDKKITSGSPTGFINAAIDQINDIIKKIFNEEITTKTDIDVNKEKFEITTTFLVSYRDTEIAELKVTSERIS